MSYKMVVDVGKLCASLAGSAIEHRDRVTAAMVEMWSNQLVDGQVLDLPTFMTCVAGDLRDIHGQLLVDSRQVNADLTEARKGRVMRDGSLVETREALFAARKMLDAMFGPGGADAVFMQPNSQVEVDPAAVFEQATVVVQNLTDPNFALPDLRLDVGVDLTALAERIRVPLGKLGEALNELSLVNPKTHASLEAKDRSFGKMSKKAVQGARLLEALFAYAGHEGIASRTRPTSHRARRDAAAARAIASTGGQEEPGKGQVPQGATPTGDGSPATPAGSVGPSPRSRHLTRAASPLPASVRGAAPAAKPVAPASPPSKSGVTVATAAEPDIPPATPPATAPAVEPSAVEPTAAKTPVVEAPVVEAPAFQALPEKEGDL